MLVSTTRPLTALACLAAALVGSSCVSGAGSTMDTPLGAPLASDHARFTVEVDDADGALHRGDNAFTVRVTNDDGTPATLVRLGAWMPTHGHTADPPLIDDQGGGVYLVHSLELLMAGEWELDLTLSHTGATDDDRATLFAELP